MSTNLIAAEDSAKLYKKQCKKCHGKKGEGKKFKKEPEKFKYAPINELSQDELLESLNKYFKMWSAKNWENKKEKKMAKATKKLDDAKIQTLAEFIVTLNK
ncbi:MAG: c-type cytochrome [SAR324 cluster bacterium]|nr:c-type cytochrome [SAR324 cluster bacterium]